MPSEARLKKYRKIKEGPKKLKFGASKTGVRGGPGPPGPPGPPLDLHLDSPSRQLLSYWSLPVQKEKRPYTGADPGFGQGGGQLPRPKVADVVKWSRASKASP